MKSLKNMAKTCFWMGKAIVVGSSPLYVQGFGDRLTVQWDSGLVCEKSLGGLRLIVKEVPVTEYNILSLIYQLLKHSVHPDLA